MDLAVEHDLGAAGGEGVAEAQHRQRECVVMGFRRVVEAVGSLVLVALVEVGLDLVAAHAQADAAVEAAFGGDGVGGGQAREQQGAEANAYIAHVHNPLMMRVLWTSSGRYAVAHGDIAI